MRAINLAALEARLTADNPWWLESSEAPPIADLPARACMPAVLNRIEAGLPTLITGPRQCGKSTILLQIAKHTLELSHAGQAILYLRADGLLNSESFYGETIARFMARQSNTAEHLPLILIDDIHCLPEWENLLEETSQRYAVARLAVVSAAPPLQSPPTFERIHLPPMTFYEFLQFREPVHGAQIAYDTDQNGFVLSSLDQVNAVFIDYLNFGGMPEATFSGSASPQARFYGRQTYLDGVLRQHLPILFGINNPQELQSIFQILIHNVGEEISIERLAEMGGVAKNTIRKYLDYFDATYQLNRLDKYDPLKGPFERARSFKLYMADPAAQAALFGPITGGPESRRAVESALLAAALLKPNNTNLFYGFWKGREIPFIAVSGNAQEKTRAYFFLDWTAVEGDALEDYAHFGALPAKALGDDPYVEVFTRSLSGVATINNVDIRFTPAALYCWEMGRQAALDWPLN
jgi:predicted AAA+ superfamily ATPase